LANQISKALYAKFALDNYGEIIKSNMDYDTALEKRCFLLENFPKEYEEAEKINLARYKRVIRLRERIKKILTTSDTVIFLTLTFTDDTLNRTSADTRRQYVRKYLGKFNVDFVANIDYGKQNGREHYHAVVGGKIDLKPWTDKMGGTNVRLVKAPEYTQKRVPKRYQNLPQEEIQKRMAIDDEKALSKYVAKLTNHAIKETTKRSCCIYPSKNKAHSNKTKLLEIVDEIHYQNPFLDTKNECYQIAIEF
jgi:hypothetical protein